MENAQSKSTRTLVRPRGKPLAALPAYGVSDNVLSFQHGLCARERATVDRALRIVGGALRQREALSCASLVKQYVRLHLGAEQVEKFAVLHLDTQNRAIAFDIMFTGTISQTSVYPREVVCAALAHRSSAVILAHNHPSGNVMPSAADKSLTNTLREALSLVDVRILDHVIVSHCDVLSMAERGML